MKTGSPLSEEEECQQVLQALRTFVVQYEPELQEVVRLIMSGTDCAFGATGIAVRFEPRTFLAHAGSQKPRSTS